MKIPAYLLTDTVTIEKYRGKSAYGYVFDEPTEYRCRVEPSRQQVRTLNGDEITTNYRAFLNPHDNNDDVPPLSRVTFRGVTYQIEMSAQQKGFTLSHIEARF